MLMKWRTKLLKYENLLLVSTKYTIIAVCCTYNNYYGNKIEINNLIEFVEFCVICYKMVPSPALVSARNLISKPKTN